MNILEVHREFKFRLDKFDSISYPNIRPEEIDLILNHAYKRYIKQRYGITNTKRTSFEEDQKRTEDLKAVIKSINLAPITGRSDENIDYNSIFVQLPSDHWFTIGERAIINCSTCNSHRF